MSKWQVLLVDDEKRILELEQAAFSSQDFQLITTTSFQRAWEIFQKQPIHLTICEWQDGQLLEQIREISDSPVMIVSEHSQGRIRIKAFQMGADDFVAKPFNVVELTLRAQRLLRYFYELPVQTQKIERYQYDFFDLDVVHRSLKLHQKQVHLTAREFDLLLLLVQNPKKVYSRKECLQKVWHYTYFGEERIVDNCIRKIREKLDRYSESAAQSIVTIWKKGYLFDPDKMKIS